MPGSSALTSTVASAAHRRRREPGLGQRAVDQRGDLVGGHAPARADADDQRRRPQHERSRSSAAGDRARSVTSDAGDRRRPAPVRRRRTFGGSGGQRPVGVGDQRAPARRRASRAADAAATAPCEPGQRRACRAPAAPTASVAVVTTGSRAEHARRPARRGVAPPAWPPSSATAYRRASSTHDHARVGALVAEQRREQPHRRAGGQERTTRVALAPTRVAQRVGDVASVEQPGLAGQAAASARRRAARPRGGGRATERRSRRSRRSPTATKTGLVAASRMRRRRAGGEPGRPASCTPSTR